MLKVSYGKKATPGKIVIYGMEGVGKSTLASMFPSPFFLDIEKGTSYLDVMRYDGEITTAAEYESVIRQLIDDPMNIRTMVIDTADWWEGVILRSMLMRDGKTSIEDYGYGKGYPMLKAEIAKQLDLLSDFQRKTGITVIFNAHAIQRKVEEPGEVDSYDHWEMKLTKYVAPLLREWCDYLLFLKFDVQISKTDNNKVVAQGGSRVICTDHTIAYDAKTRQALPKKIILNENGVKQLLSVIYADIENEPSKYGPRQPQPVPQPVPQSQPMPEAVPAQSAQPQPEPVQQPAEPQQTSPFVEKFPGQSDLMDKVNDLLILNGLKFSDLELATSHPQVRMRPKGTPLDCFSEEDLKRIIGGWEAVYNTIKTIKASN